MLTHLTRRLTRWLAQTIALDPDLTHLDDGVRRLRFGDEPWDVWGDE